ncbi:MAG: bile acid:sodium symporter family protein [Thermoguttaceae bacterium]|jgi:BASS family bile acid:Na+ symporter|nr:bile acid:sodium symporter family protein [Thermoguttaceae bacterium]
MAIALTLHMTLKSLAFTGWVLACVATALVYPWTVSTWFGYDLTRLIVPLTQIIMFGMGTTLSPRDFARVAIFPWPVCVGVLLQFTVMPVTGYVIARSFGFEGEVAAGIVLIGSCSGGVASNLMAYLARGNVALSVTMTCISTFLSPVMTPLMMGIFAGEFIEIQFLPMMVSIFNMIIVPVVAGLMSHAILYSRKPWAKRGAVLLVIVAGCVAAAVLAPRLPAEPLGAFAPLRYGAAMGAGLIAFVALAKLVVNVLFRGTENWMDRALPLVSMTAICFIRAIITAQTRDVLLAVGAALVAAAILHNGIGYLLGYWCARLLGYALGVAGYLVGYYRAIENQMDESDCRTVAFEVGMQNGGMATGIALDVLKSHVAALPPNVFGTGMNISGSMLANWWKRKPAVA